MKKYFDSFQFLIKMSLHANRWGSMREFYRFIAITKIFSFLFLYFSSSSSTERILMHLFLCLHVFCQHRKVSKKIFDALAKKKQEPFHVELKKVTSKCICSHYWISIFSAQSSRRVLLRLFCHFVGTILKSLLVNDSFK